MPVKRCTIKGVTSLEDLYDQLARCLSLPGDFGRNLDALWDVLSTDVEGPFEIVWEEAGFSRQAMGEDFERARSLLEDLQKERDDFRIIFH